MIQVTFYIVTVGEYGGREFHYLGVVELPTLPQVGHVMILGEATYRVREVSWHLEEIQEQVMLQGLEVYLGLDE